MGKRLKTVLLILLAGSGNPGWAKNEPDIYRPVSPFGPFEVHRGKTSLTTTTLTHPELYVSNTATSYLLLSIEPSDVPGPFLPVLRDSEVICPIGSSHGFVALWLANGQRFQTIPNLTLLSIGSPIVWAIEKSFPRL